MKEVKEPSKKPFIYYYIIVLIVMLLLNALVVNRLRGRQHAHHHAPCHARTVLRVEGMNCNHCAANARKALESVEGVEKAEVDLASGTAFVEGG